MALRSLVASLVVVLACAAPAGAAVTSSEITDPADGAKLNLTAEAFTNTYNVKGDTDGTSGVDTIDLVCDRGPAQGFDVIATALALGTNGAIDVNVNPGAAGGGLCTLYAVPHDWDPTDSLTGFTGNRIVVDLAGPQHVAAGPNSGKLVDFFIGNTGIEGYADFFSVTSCGLCDMQLVDRSSFQSSRFLFYSNAGLYRDDATGRAYLRIGESNAFGPYTASIDNDVAPGLPELAYTYDVDAVTRDSHTTEDEALVRCPDPNVLEPTPSNCPEFLPTGVTFHRDIFTREQGKVWEARDVFANTTGAPIHLDLRFDQYQQEPKTGLSGWSAPWIAPGYASVSDGQELPPPPSAPATLFVQHSLDLPPGGFENPLGALTFSWVPNLIHFVDHRSYLLGYDGTIPPGGKVELGQIFRMSTTQAELDAGVLRDQDALKPSPVVPAPPATDSRAPLVGSFNSENSVFAVAGTPTALNAQRRPRAKRGTKFRYAVDEAGKVTIEIQRQVAGVKIRKRVGRRTRNTCVTASRGNLRTLRRQLSRRSAVKRLSGKAKSRALARLVRRARCSLFRRVNALTRNVGAGPTETPFSGRLGNRALSVGTYRALLVARDAAGNASRPKTARFRIVKP